MSGDKECKKKYKKLVPDPTAEYIYDHYMAWKFGDGSITGTQGMIATNVSLNDGRFTFYLKGHDLQEFDTQYGWSFILNTPKNMKRYKKMKEMGRLRDFTQQKYEYYSSKVEKLEDEM